jgi:hypothetical protein
LGPRIGMNVLFIKYSLVTPFDIVIFIPSFMRIIRVAQNLPWGQTHMPHKSTLFSFSGGKENRKAPLEG